MRTTNIDEQGRQVSQRIATTDEHEVDLLALWRIIWGYKLLIALCAAVSGAIAVYIALTSVSVFRAEAVVTEVREKEMGSAGALMNQLGGLASLAGMTLGAGGANREARAILESRQLAEEFVKRNRLVPVLLPGSPTTLWAAVEEFRTNIALVSEDPRKGTIGVAVEWTDPAVAAQWANGLVSLANEMVRERALADAKRNIKYLNEQIGLTNVVEIQRVMYNLIESETKMLMFANGRAEYAFTVVDPAVPPEMRVRPRRTVLVILGTIIGVFIGILAAFSHNMWARQKQSSRQV